MCCEDVKIDFERLGYYKEASLGANTPGELCGPDPHRISLMIGVPDSGHMYVAPDNQAAAGHGFYLTTNTLPLRITRHEHGSLVGKAWWGVCNGNAVIPITETLQPPGGVCDGK